MLPLAVKSGTAPAAEKLAISRCGEVGHHLARVSQFRMQRPPKGQIMLSAAVKSATSHARVS